MSDKSLTLDEAAEIDILRINEVRSKNSGDLIGFELVTHPGGQKLLVFADQLAMPGFRIGDSFVPGYGDTLVIGESTVFPTAPAEFGCVHHTGKVAT